MRFDAGGAGPGAILRRPLATVRTYPVKARLEGRLAEALAALQADGTVPANAAPDIAVTRTRDPAHGDFATNLALQLAKPAGRKPREIAEALVAALPASDFIRETAIAGPGFVNFFVTEEAQSAVVRRVLEAGEAYGRGDVGAGTRVQVEFVSANPTGPLHVGHGRGAALGATIANLLEATGFEVQREYYVNDAGRQMDILGVSVWLRYLELAGEPVRFPTNGYRGGYVRDVAAALREAHGDAFVRPADDVTSDLPADARGAGGAGGDAAAVPAGNDADAAADAADGPDDEGPGGDKDAHVDALVVRARSLLGDDGWRVVFDAGLEAILDDIREDLTEFRVRYDEWFSERSLQPGIPGVLARLEAGGHTYERGGSVWFRSTDFGDDKDRVVVREDGRPTYLASDIAYLDDKMARGFDRVLYLFGADHHGYVTRMRAVCEALGHDVERLEFLLIQFAILYRGSERVQMSTRSGSFVTLRELRDEVGTDAARWFYVMRRHQAHLDFDLELAKSTSKDNPVFYVQYAHARICSVEREARGRGMAADVEAGLRGLGRLTEPEDGELMTLLAAWPETLEGAALAREPHRVTGYLRDLANGLQRYYTLHKVLVDDAPLRNARLALLFAVRRVLANGLAVIDVSAPEVM